MEVLFFFKTMLKPTNLLIFTVPEEVFISVPLDKLRMLLATTLHFTMEATADEKYNFLYK